MSRQSLSHFKVKGISRVGSAPVFVNLDIFGIMAVSLPPPSSIKEGENFMTWIKSVEIYMGAIDVKTASQKVNIVLHLLGPDVQGIIASLPEGEGTNEYEKLKDQLEKHFKPKVNTVVERHQFNTMVYEGGRVEGYVAKLKTQARKCDFDVNEVDNLVRDKLVATCPSSRVKESMLKEEKLTLTKAMVDGSLYGRQMPLFGSKLGRWKCQRKEHQGKMKG